MTDATDPAVFRSAATRAVGWISDFLEHPEQWDVLPDITPGDVGVQLPEFAPEAPESLDAILDDFEAIIAPANTQWNHPGFFAYFGISSTGPAIVAEMLAATLNPNAMLWMSSPAATELEMRVLSWLRELVGLPSDFFGTITDTASTSILYALAIARHKALPESSTRGLAAGPAGRVYVSEETHSSAEKAVMTLGLGHQGVRRIGTDDGFRMRPKALEAAIAADRAAGVVPIAVVATAGTTSTTSVDPVEAIADIAEREGLWLHVDAAYGGCAAVLPELASLFTGWERADSIVINPHKWLFVPIDCSALYVRDPELFRAAFSVTPEYLRTPMDGSAPNLMEYGVALGRRFRSLKLWFAIRALGAEGIRALIRGHIRMANDFATWVDRADGWERMAPTPFSLVAFRNTAAATPEAQDEANRRILSAVNKSGEVFLSHTVLNGRTCLRLAVGNYRTRDQHVHRAWALLSEAAAQVDLPSCEAAE